MPQIITDGSQVGDRVIQPMRHNIPLIGCRVTNSADISIPNTTLTALTFDTDTFNQGGTMHSTTTNTSRITFPFGGWYDVTGVARFAANANASYRRAWIRLNGAATYLDIAEIIPNGTTPGTLKLATLYKFASADYIELVVSQDSGGALLCTSAQSAPYFSAMWRSS